MIDDREPPSGGVGGDSGGEGPPPEQPVMEEPPPYSPDPELITFLEREGKPGEVKVWHPEKDK